MRYLNVTVKRPSEKGTTVAPAKSEVAQDVLDRELAEQAGQEVAEATSPFLGAGIAVEAAAQAEAVAHGEIRTEEHEGELTAQVRREVSKSVFRLAWPAIAENALQTLMGIVDTIVVARLGTAALSGVGLAQQLVWILTTALVAISMGTTVLIARYTGAKQRGEANSVLKQSLMLSALMSLLLMPIGLLSHPLMSILGLEPLAAGEGAIYLQITLFSALPLVMMLIAGAALRGSGDTRTPMFVTASINVVNAILAVELVFGGEKASGILGSWLSGLAHLVGLGQVNLPALSWIPEMGVAGSAWASVTARTIGTIILLGVLVRPKRFLNLLGRSGGAWRPNLDIVKRILGIGIPTAFEQLFMSLGVLLYNFLVIGMGEVVFATSRVALNIVFISQMPGFGFSIAATTLVGQSLGAKSPKRARLGAQLSTRSAVIWMGAMGVVFFFFGDVIMRVFTDDQRLIQLGADCLKVIAFYQPSLAVAFVLGGALRGAGDVRYPMWVTTCAVWLVRLPVGAFLGLNVVCVPFTGMCAPGFNLGLIGIYRALILEATVRAVLMFFRFRGGKWQQMKV